MIIFEISVPYRLFINLLADYRLQIIENKVAREMHDFQEQRQVQDGWRVAALHTAKENIASRFASSTGEEIESLTSR